MAVFLTGYSFWDNTPPGSTAIARPVLRDQAGGTGTYEDPVTLAVGHRIENGISIPDYVPGTMFYIPKLRRYAIVEDLCGDGPRPQAIACHIGYQGHVWLDIYVDGQQVGVQASDACMRRFTAIQPMILHPGPGYPVDPGAIAESGCKVYETPM